MAGLFASKNLPDNRFFADTWKSRFVLNWSSRNLEVPTTGTGTAAFDVELGFPGWNHVRAIGQFRLQKKLRGGTQACGQHRRRTDQSERRCQRINSSIGSVVRRIFAGTKTVPMEFNNDVALISRLP